MGGGEIIFYACRQHLRELQGSKEKEVSVENGIQMCTTYSSLARSFLSILVTGK